MSRGPQNFKQADVTKAIKAAVKAGLKDWRVEIEDGKIVILSGDGSNHTDHDDRSSEWD